MEEPAHRLAREVAADGPCPDRRGQAPAAPQRRLVLRIARRSAAGWTWRTIYHHPAGAAAVVQWFTSTALRFYLGPLDPAEQQAFLAEYQSRIERAYPALSDGTVLLPFPRLFIVAGAK